MEEVRKAKEAIGSSVETSGRNDVLAQVLGKDKYGTLRSTGFGATATNTWGLKQQRTMSEEEEVDSMKEELQEVREKLSDIEKAQAAELQSYKQKQLELEEELRLEKEERGKFESELGKFLHAVNAFSAYQDGLGA